MFMAYITQHSGTVFFVLLEPLLIVHGMKAFLQEYSLHAAFKCNSQLYWL